MGTSHALLRLGVSQCLLGEPVRYDGGHKADPFVIDRLGPMVEWMAVCPELEAGLGVPREPIHLTGDPIEPGVEGVHSGVAHRDRLEGWSRRRLLELDTASLDGFVLKSRSPSCGLEAVAVHRDGEVVGASRGLFARALLDHDPALPVCEAEALELPASRHAFLLRACSRRLARSARAVLPNGDWRSSATWNALLEAHELALLSRGHDPLEMRRLCESERDSAAALGRLARALARAEEAEGTRRALSTAVGWMEELDSRTWPALATMLDEVGSGSMEPEVARITLHLVARSERCARLTGQLYLRPMAFVADADGDPGEDSTPPARRMSCP